jgi:ribosomal protein S18 acetylase RimI-like enzyme
MFFMNQLTTIENEIPTEVYRYLREKTGLSPKTHEAADKGLQNSIYSLLIKDCEEPIGMGRIIGDGGCHCQVVDICVLPDYQGKGIGKIIMEKIMNFIDTELPESCYISLIADGPANHLYAKFGFKEVMPKSRGMYYRVQ